MCSAHTYPTGKISTARETVPSHNREPIDFYVVPEWYTLGACIRKSVVACAVALFAYLKIFTGRPSISFRNLSPLCHLICPAILFYIPYQAAFIHTQTHIYLEIHISIL